ncbi:MAG TPA: chemotaxis protein CheW [Mycobacteriales bacterium]|nr:chemotaxis protein CheW [Mycobacteriales bacterium]
MVHFVVAGTAYCLPVDAARAVRTAAGMVTLPAGRPDVTGIIPGDPPLSVLSVLGPGGRQILVVETGGKRFGLLVDAVSGLRRVAEADIRPAPEGQDRRLVAGTIEAGDELVLVADPVAMAARL